MKKKLTQKEKQEQFIQDVKTRFCEMFEITEEQYCEYEYEKAFQYLNFKRLPEAYTYSKTFWNWWKLTNATSKNSWILAGKKEPTKFENISIYSSLLKQIKNESLNAIA